MLLYDCPYCQTKGILPMSDMSCPNCKKSLNDQKAAKIVLLQQYNNPATDILADTSTSNTGSEKGTELCETCGTAKHLILSHGEHTGKTICLTCNPPNGVCPVCGGQLRTPKAKQCSKCKSSWHRTCLCHGSSDDSQISSEAGSKKNDNFLVEVWFPDGSTIRYKDINEFKHDVFEGKIRRDYKARLPSDVSHNEEGDENTETNEHWITVSDVVKREESLRSPFRPVSGAIGKGVVWGIGVGIVLKAIDTTLMFFMVDPIHGVAWLAIVGVLAAMNIKACQKALPYIIGGSIYAVFKFGIPIDIFTSKFMAMLSTMLVGAIFGAPSGSVVGAIVGFFRSRRLAKKVDLEDEGAKPYVLGLILPFTFLAFAIPFWIFWLTPKMMEWISE